MSTIDSLRYRFLRHRTFQFSLFELPSIVVERSAGMATGTPVIVQKIKQDPDQQEKAKKRKLSELLEGPVSVTVKVGKGETARTWTLPKDLLTSASTFFDAAFKHSWSESESKSVELKEDKPDAFAFFVQWLYIRACSSDPKGPYRISPEIDPMISLHAWILGDKLGCPEFQDYALLHLWDRVSKGAIQVGAIIRPAYGGTPPRSKLRVFLAGLLLTYMVKNNVRFADNWGAILDELDDLANDIVRLLMFEARPYDYKANWPSSLLASAFNDYVFESSV
ncbi:MAG: hypothetical protein Q9207_001101 [Kuettlingeria erythrocarpa]